MTVKDLKEKLAEYPDDYLIYLYDDLEDFLVKANNIDLVNEDSCYFIDVKCKRGIKIVT